jgi:uncharacterized membrane protein YccF (DUF307 family)
MALLGNIIWFLMGGWLLFIIYTLAAILFFPVFVPIFRIARYSLFPFGKSIVSQDELNKYRESQGSPTENSTAKRLSGVLNIVWMLTFGWILALTHLVASFVNLCLFFLIVTIPNISGHFKMVRIAFMPFNKVIIPRKLAEEIEVEIAKGKLKI